MTGALHVQRPANATQSESPIRWRILALVGVAEFLGMSLWFAASAAAPHLARQWGLGDQQVALLTTAVQLGFVLGTAIAAVLNLADLIPSRRFFAASALVAAAANAAVLVAPSYGVALGLRFATGAALAGVYPPAMKMVATWFRSGRGVAIGTVVGALTLGKATPYLTRALSADPRWIVLAASAGATLAALLVGLGYRDGPFAFPRRPFSLRLAATVAAHRPTRLATAGYLGHMWELYAMWAWVPAFLAASNATRGGDALSAAGVDLLAFAAIAAGAVGCVAGGAAADRIGRAPWVSASLAASGLCSLAAGLFFGAPTVLVAGLLLVWGFWVVADSAQFSALVTETAPPHAVGTALTLQTSLGFLLTTLSIHLVPALAERAGWRWSFAILALGPAAGLVAIRRLTRPPAT